MKELPIACSLDAEDLGHRRCEFQRIADFTEDLQLSGSGMKATFEARPGIIAELAQLIEIERECCRFLRFRLTIEEGGGPIRLDVSGPPGTDTFLREVLGVGTRPETTQAPSGSGIPDTNRR
jgi:hypothetical protein